MIDPQRLLADEAEQGVGVAVQEHLGGHVAAAPVVPGPPHRARPAPSDRVGQLVPPGEDLTHRAAPAPVASFSAGPPTAGPVSSGATRSGRPLGGAPGAVHPEELCQLRVGRGERVGGVDDVAGGGDGAQQGLDLADDPAHGRGAGDGAGLAGAGEDGAALRLLDLLHPVRGLGGADAAVGDLNGELLEGLDALDDRRIADLRPLAAHQLGQHGRGEPEHGREPGLVEPEVVDQATEERPSGSPYQLR